MKVIELVTDTTSPDVFRNDPAGDVPPFFMEFKTRSMKKVLDQAARLARTRQTVLVRGETGTGKSRLARWIWERSGREGMPMIQKSCGEFHAGTASSDLYGHVKGAYSGADKDRWGLFAEADKGTLILDDIDYLPRDSQRLLLRQLDDAMIQRMGDSARNAKKVDVRLIVTTNKDLGVLAASDLFLHDLYHRICVFSLVIPPLRERKEDIPHLARMYLDRVWREEEPGSPEPWYFSGEVMEMLHSRQWPGNMRELEGVVRNLAILTEGDHRPITLEQARDILLEMFPSAPGGNRARAINDEKMYQLLQTYGGNKSLVAALMGVCRNTVYDRIRRNGWHFPR